MDGVVIEPDARQFTRVARALQDEASGDEWTQELASDLHAALEPGVTAVRSAVMGMATGGLPHAGEGLRQAVAAQVESIVRTSGPRAGARIRAGKPAVRGFRNAPARLNSLRGWRHPVFGDYDTWVHQTGAPDWFDGTLRRLRPALRAAAEKALDKRAQRISRRSGG